MLARRGVRVAPFKAQNMSNNSVVTLDGGEIGRAQAFQARACGLEPSVRFNPVLLKPGSDRTSQLVVRGQAVAQVSASNYIEHRQALRSVVASELAALRAEYDVVICEGAGSPAEINLRAKDLANMGLATAAGLPVIVIGDIDRGGVLAHLYGTLAVLSPEDQSLIKGFVINKFRGDPDLLAPGLDQLESLTGRKTYGVIPYSNDLWMDAEDSLGTVADAPVGRPRSPLGSQWLRVSAIRLPRISNTTDVEALACEPGVSVHWVTEPSRLTDADLVVVPGSKSTLDDLAWLRRTGLADAIVARAAEGRPILGICGGYQMLGKSIIDPIESTTNRAADGLGLLDLDIEFETAKIVTGVSGSSPYFDGTDVAGYEIHHGRVVRNGDTPLMAYDDGREEGSVRGAVIGTHWHGILESDGFRRHFLQWAAAQSGREGFVVATDVSVAAMREQQIDLLADLVENNIDVDAVLAVIERGVDGAGHTIRRLLD